MFTSGLDQVCVPLPPWALRAGARETIYHNPATTTAAIVTCGGLCPGLNDVVQGIVYKLTDYGVSPDRILGIRNGFKGFYAKDKKPMTPLGRDQVDGIHLQGGTMLGTSRGGADIPTIVKRISQVGTRERKMFCRRRGEEKEEGGVFDRIHHHNLNPAPTPLPFPFFPL